MHRPSLHNTAANSTSAEIAACRRGERAAIEAVLQRHATMLERVLIRLVGPNADAEDLLQETFAEAITAFARFRGDAAVGTWLYRIAVNVAHKQLRRPQRRCTVSLEVVAGAASDTDARRRPDELAQRRQLVERLYTHLDALAAKKRIAFLLHVIDDRSLAEVAALMGATRAATKSRVFFARRELLSRVRKDPGLRDLVACGEGDR
jgi:RNA polymerase sigma-70 factor (ECF subfamily)